LKDEYIANYKQCYEIIREDVDREVGEVGPDLIIEQYMLSSIASKNKAKLCTVLDDKRLFEDALQRGFTHVIGKSKYAPENQSKLWNLCKQLHPDGVCRQIAATVNRVAG
jgi:predicted kinase